MSKCNEQLHHKNDAASAHCQISMLRLRRARAAGSAENGAFLEAPAGKEGAGAVSDARLLPFPRGALSFGVGIGLKLAVTRWANWAADAGLHSSKKSAEEGCDAGQSLSFYQKASSKAEFSSCWAFGPD